MINKNINTNNINKEELKYIIYLSEKHKFDHNCTNNQIMQPTKKYLINELKKEYYSSLLTSLGFNPTIVVRYKAVFNHLSIFFYLKLNII